MGGGGVDEGGAVAAVVVTWAIELARTLARTGMEWTCVSVSQGHVHSGDMCVLVREYYVRACPGRDRACRAPGACVSVLDNPCTTKVARRPEIS